MLDFCANLPAPKPIILWILRRRGFNEMMGFATLYPSYLLLCPVTGSAALSSIGFFLVKTCQVLKTWQV